LTKAAMTQASLLGRLRIYYAGTLGEPVAKPAVWPVFFCKKRKSAQ